ncbi:MAG: Dabb family protein [Pelolinea sp.]|nr:Dabb family protein [Pelolinea sp.]
MLRHVVGVNLNYSKDDPRVKGFFQAAKNMLATIPQVKSYTHYFTDNPECGYQYGFVLDFESKEALLEYFENPNHLKFSDDEWTKGVASYLDFNFIPFDERKTP